MISSRFEKFQHVEQLVREKKWEEALQEVKKLENSKGLTGDEQIACQILENQIFTRIGSLETGLQLVDQILDQRQTIQNQLLLLDAITAKDEVLSKLRRFTAHYPQLGLFIR